MLFPFIGADGRHDSSGCGAAHVLVAPNVRKAKSGCHLAAVDVQYLPGDVATHAARKKAKPRWRWTPAHQTAT